MARKPLDVPETIQALPLNLGIDPAYAKIDPIGTPLCRDVWKDKYCWDNESYDGMAIRVSDAVYAKETDPMPHVERACIAIQNQLWMPAGRILAGAGTPKRVTLLNCFVNEDMEDDMASIAEGLGNIMLTMQQGGGIGTDFSPLRPPLAILRRTGAKASGPGPFIDTWDSACTTIRSAGDRRGAMMGTLICTHPFLPEFINAKHEKGRWTNFNVSVLITDAFMGAVAENEAWYLHHPVPPAFERGDELASKDFRDNSGTQQYVYSVHRARDLWDLILRSTYEYAEPGVIFIDRVNDRNNLQYCETINCTNPCGEQPLPAHGCCDLGAVQLSRMVKDPFGDDPEFNWELLDNVTRIGTRFLDNVIDVTNYPLPKQQEEEFAKRRIGVGMGGLADAMHMLNMRYGSPRSIGFTEKVAQRICFGAYSESIELAKEKGPFPLFRKDEYLARPFIKSLPEDIQQGIAEHGIRNGVLLTIAPTGTTSLAYGNCSSGLEPVFAHSMRRKVRQQDGEYQPYEEVAYGARLFLALNPDRDLDSLPAHMNVCADVPVYEHIRIQEVCQRWVDASISKTINLPTEISYDDFQAVYQLAYDSELKGCTTYRPSEVRGSILDVSGPASPVPVSEGIPEGSGVANWKQKRPDELESRTIKIRWPKLSSAIYLTIGYLDGRPFEVFLNSKDQTALEWTSALTVLISMSLRAGIPLPEIADEFKQIHALEGAWHEGRYWPSLIAYIGSKLPRDSEAEEIVEVEVELAPAATTSSRPMQCPSCHEYTLIMQSGCPTCTNCGYSKCG